MCLAQPEFKESKIKPYISFEYRLDCNLNVYPLYTGVRHPGLETFLKNTTSAIKANAEFLIQTSKQSVPGEDKNNQKSLEWYSIFPVENSELVYGNWEDKIIWDAEV